MSTSLAQDAVGQELTVQLDAASQSWISRDQTIRLIPSRPLAPADGRLAVLVGNTDLTDLFVQRGTALEYAPGVFLLPPGESEMTVHLVSPDGQWNEIARFALRVLTGGGFERASLVPRLDLQGTGVLDESARPEGSTGTAGTSEGTLNAHLGGTLERNGWRLTARAHTIGVTEREKALRFAQDGPDAPNVDLADYSVRLDRPGNDRAFFELGHVSYGQHRYLMPGFSSRGIVLGMPLGRAASLNVATVNGTSIVGWRNITGLSTSDHRITSAGVGFELLPENPGSLRLNIDYLDGSLLPLSGFNTGDIADRQTSRAWGARLSAATRSGSLRLDAGYAHSAFHNPFDPTLAQGADLVPVEREERGARYADLNWQIIQSRSVGNHAANLALSLRHERVDPQYATVAAQVQSDIQQNIAEINGALGPLLLQVSHAQAEDNLDEIASILTTETRRSRATLGLATAELFARADALHAWLPVASYSFERTHQAGTGVPENSGFNASHVPDQISRHHAAGLDWQGARWTFGYRTDYSAQDNRQPGREQADFTHLVHAASVSLAAHENLDLTFELSAERSAAQETRRIERTRNVGAGFEWDATRRLHLSARAGLTRAHDDPRSYERQSTFLDVGLTWRLEWKTAGEHGLSGQLFLRYSDLGSQSLDRLFGFDVNNRTRTLVGGLNLSIE